MAKIALIGLYDSWMIGLRNLSNALIEHGHEVSMIHFKLMASHKESFYIRNTLQYQTIDTIVSRDKVFVCSYNTDAKLWNYNELMLLGDLLKELKPDIIGLSTRSVYEKYTLEIIEQIKRVDGAITIAGGHDASFRPEVYLDHFDFVCIGEGEDAIVELAESIECRDEQKTISNLVFKEKGKVISNNMRLPKDKMDHFFSTKMEKVKHFVITNNRAIRADALLRNVDNIHYYYTMAGRGCTGRCAYCSAGHFQMLYTKRGVTLKTRRMRHIENVVKELKYAKEKGFKEVTFLDSFLIAKRDYLLSFFDVYKREVRLPFFAQLHPEQVRTYPEILDAALDAGMTRTVLGIQSGSERINKQIFNRKTSHAHLLDFANQMVGRGNLRVDYHLVTHNPFDKEEDVENTLLLLRNLPKKNTSLFLFKLHAFVNTKIERLIKDANFGELDRETHDKRALIYLIRFFASDEDFNKIYSNFQNLSFEALKSFYASLKKTHKSDVDFVQFGQMYFQKMDFQKADDSFSLALDLNPGNFDALHGKGRIYMKKGDLKKAESFFREALIQYPTGMKALWKDMGDLMMKSGRVKEAIECYGKVKDMSSPYWQAEYGGILTKLGFAHLEYGNLEYSKEIFTTAMDYMEGIAKTQTQELLERIDQKLIQSQTPNQLAQHG